MNNKTKLINDRISKYRDSELKNLSESYLKSQNRLKALVEKHGIEHVSLASGLSIKTVKQYIQVTVPPCIKKETVDKAESILEGL